MSHEDLALLLRLNKSWHDGISAENLYEITRAWWVMSPANAQRVARILAVAGGIVREVYQPTRWLPSPVEGLENRIGFDGVVASDRERYVGRDVTHLFRYGSANPVRYLPLNALIEDAVIAPDPALKTRSAGVGQVPGGAVEPGLLERILPLCGRSRNSPGLRSRNSPGPGLFLFYLMFSFPVGMTRPGLLFGR
jgi:hypothetical protein